MIVVLTAIALASHMHAAAGGGSFVDRFETIDWGRWDYRGSFMLGGHGSDAYIALRDDEHLSHGAGGLTMTMNDQPCASNASACCCSGEQTIPCVQNFSAAAAGAGAHPARRCAQFATGHLLSKVSYGYGTYEAAIQFSGAKGAVSFFDIGEHELCESPHEETQVKTTRRPQRFLFHCVSSGCLTHDDGGAWCVYPSFTTPAGTTGTRGTTAASISRLGARPDPWVPPAIDAARCLTAIDF